MKPTLILTALVLVAAPLAARPIPDAPVPQAGSAKLAVLVGSWSGDAEIAETGKPPAKARVKIDCRETSGGWGVRCDAAFLSSGMNYLESDLFGYDAVTGKVHMYSVTNAGEVHDHAGSWTDDSLLSVRHSGPSSGGDLTEDLTLRFEGRKALAFDVVTTIAGAQAGTLRGRVMKQR